MVERNERDLASNALFGKTWDELNDIEREKVELATAKLNSTVKIM